MTQRIAWIGAVATAIIILVMLIAALREPARMDRAKADQQAEAIQRGMDLYAFHCAECHGSRGQGEIEADATDLADEYIQNQDTDFLYKAIARGRNDTDMAAFHIDEGGALNRQQIESLITIIRDGSWNNVAIRVAELDMVSEEELALADVYALEEAIEALPMIMVIPTQVPAVAPASIPNNMEPPPAETHTDTLPGIAVVPTDPANTETLPSIAIVPTEASADLLPLIAIKPTETSNEYASALNLYAVHCAECHGVNGAGMEDIPALHIPRVQTMSARELGRISFDNAQIEGHDTFLMPDEKVALITLMQHGFDERGE